MSALEESVRNHTSAVAWAVWLTVSGLTNGLLAARPAIAVHLPQLLPQELSVQTRWDMLTLTMSVSKREFRLGETVEVSLTLENTGLTPVVLINFPFETFDLLVYNDQGVKIWAWRETRPPLPLGTPELRHLAQGEVFSTVLAWDHMLSSGAAGRARLAPPGTYFLEGLLPATLQDRPPPVTLRTPRLSITLTR